MQELNQALEALERACEGEEELISFAPINTANVVELLKALPADQRVAVQERLDRVATVIEGKMMIYAEELQQLGGQIRNVANNNAATNAYRTVAVFPVNQNTDSNS